MIVVYKNNYYVNFSNEVMKLYLLFLNTMIAQSIYRNVTFITNPFIKNHYSYKFTRQMSTNNQSLSFNRKDRTYVIDIFDNPNRDGLIQVSGWIKSIRSACKGTLLFIDLTDSTTVKPLQITVSDSMPNFEQLKNLTTGSSASFIGRLSNDVTLELKLDSEEFGHKFHIYNKITNNSNYPILKHVLKVDYIRSYPHLRPRTRLGLSIIHTRSLLFKLTHQYFNKERFTHISTPVITTMDAEGAASQFNISPNNFFVNPAFLTVSGQLALEALTCSVGDTYTLGPTFRAENSNTTRHLAEFWMLEVECSFAHLKDLISVASDYIKYIAKNLIDTEWIKYLDEYNGGVIEMLKHIINDEIVVVEFDECIKIIGTNSSTDKSEIKEISRDHEKMLVEHFGNKLIAITNFPSTHRPFYMKRTNDSKSTLSFDIIAPGVGEIVGGSERENDYNQLINQMNEHDMDTKCYEKYLEMAKYGSIPHGGFGIGIERLLMLTTGTKNIRDVISFPRTINHAEF